MFAWEANWVQILENMSILKRSESTELQCCETTLKRNDRLYFCFQYHIFCFYNFVSTTSPLSKFRNQTHVIARTLARHVENKVLLGLVLVEEIIDCVPKLVFVWAPNQAAMTRSSNRLRRFPPHEPFARLRKFDFPNMLMVICSPMFFDRFLSLF